MENKYFLKNLRCPQCHSGLEKQGNVFICLSCGKKYGTVNDIPDFRNKDSYWCNVSREKMQKLNDLSKKSGDWLGSAKKIVPEYSDHFSPFYRADCQFLWPADKESVILDAGSMWGGIAIPAAQYHKEVYAVDKTAETLGFLNIRAKQMGFRNIHTVAADLRSLPFPNNFFDLVVLNGVLEWVAFDEDVVLENQWKKTGRGLKIRQEKKYSENPTQMQLKVLKEINRVLKPGGSLYLAMENSIGYIYLLGWPDDHVNLPFVSFLPRFLANFITKLLLNCQYRTYVYDIPGYRSLLEKSGFLKSTFYGAFHHYIKPSQVIPLELISSLKKEIFANKRWQLKLVSKFIPAGLLKYLSPSIICIAHKSFKPNHEPRIKQIFQKANLISNDCPDFKAVKWDSRLRNDLPVNYLVYDNSSIPAYFCKIARSKKLASFLKAEAENLKSINLALKNTELKKSLPQLAYYGVIDGIAFLATKYAKAEKSGFNFNSRLSCKNIKQLSREIDQAIEFIAKFQKHTVKRKVNAVKHLSSVIKSQIEVLKKKGFLDKEAKSSLKDLLNEVKNLRGIDLPIVSIQGDFDFFCNIMFTKDGLKVFDFEHYEPEGLPFLDFITLVFNPLLVSHEYQKNNLPIIEILKKPELEKHLREWFSKYSELSGLPKELLRLAPAIAALEQKTKNYPESRNPESFPIYNQKAFKEMIALRINL